MDILKSFVVSRFPFTRGLGLLIACLALAATGCGETAKQYSGPVSQVTGKVLLASGKPLTSGRIIFLPQESGGMPATGDIGSDGGFTLKSPDGRDGAGPGTYKVRIEPAAELRAKKGKTAPPLPFPAIYTDEDGDTGLTATVKGEPTQVEFKLTPPAKGASKRSRLNDD